MDEVATFALTDAGQHVEAWSDMLSASDPPILSTPISPFLGEHAFRSGSSVNLLVMWLI